MHLLGFGPRRIETADTYPTQPFLTGPGLKDNQETWLDESDLDAAQQMGRSGTPEHRPDSRAASWMAVRGLAYRNDDLAR